MIQNRSFDSDRNLNGKSELNLKNFDGTEWDRDMLHTNNDGNVYLCHQQ